LAVRTPLDTREFFKLRRLFHSVQHDPVPHERPLVLNPKRRAFHFKREKSWRYFPEPRGVKTRYNVIFAKGGEV